MKEIKNVSIEKLLQDIHIKIPKLKEFLYKWLDEDFDLLQEEAATKEQELEHEMNVEEILKLTSSFSHEYDKPLFLIDMFERQGIDTIRIMVFLDRHLKIEKSYLKTLVEGETKEDLIEEDSASYYLYFVLHHPAQLFATLQLETYGRFFDKIKSLYDDKKADDPNEP